MAVFCPEKNGPALYPECTECEDKTCKNPPEDAFYLLVVGSRTFTQQSYMYYYLDFYLSKQTKIVIVSGGAKGADTLAKEYVNHARINGKSVWYVEYPYNRYKNGYERNKAMHEYIAKKKKRAVMLFWNGISKGSSHSLTLAKEYQNPLLQFVVRDQDFPICSNCGHIMEPVWYEEEVVFPDKIIKSHASVNYFLCDHCGKKELVDDSFDGPWIRKIR